MDKNNLIYIFCWGRGRKRKKRKARHLLTAVWIQHYATPNPHPYHDSSHGKLATASLSSSFPTKQKRKKGKREKQREISTTPLFPLFFPLFSLSHFFPSLQKKYI